jgi:hypothetical protein
MRAAVNPPCATVPSMPGAVAIDGAVLSCVPAAPLTYICSPSCELLAWPLHFWARYRAERSCSTRSHPAHTRLDRAATATCQHPTRLPPTPPTRTFRATSLHIAAAIPRFDHQIPHSTATAAKSIKRQKNYRTAPACPLRRLTSPPVEHSNQSDHENRVSSRLASLTPCAPWAATRGAPVRHRKVKGTSCPRDPRESATPKPRLCVRRCRQRAPPAA